MKIARRNFLATAGATVSTALALAQRTPVKIGVDLASTLGANKWTPFQFLDYLTKTNVQVAQFSLLMLGQKATDEASLKQIRAYADRLGIELAAFSGSSVCPSSRSFKPQLGTTAEEQITCSLNIARIFGASVVRVYVGTAAERPNIEVHIENTLRVLKGMRSRILDSGIKLAMENHSGDLEAREVRTLVEEVGRDFLGVCLDTGNSVVMLQDPHLTLETLGPYVLNTHIRDSALWRVPEGVAVRTVNMGEGNVDMAGWVKKFVRMHPGVPVTFETSVSGQPQILRVFEPEIWKAFPTMPAWEFSRFLALAERGKPVPPVPLPPGKSLGQQQCEDLEVCVRRTRDLLGSI